MNFKKLTNEEDQVRCELLGIHQETDESKWSGGTERYDGLTVENAKTLIYLGYLDPKDCQNYSPNAGVMVEFCERNKGFTMHGYAVSRDRDDCRVTIEGVEGQAELIEDTEEFIRMFRQADEFEIDFQNGNCYCWYD